MTTRREETKPYPLFKGATRAPTILGVPTNPLLFMTMGVAAIALTAGLRWWILWPALCFVMAQITKNDDKAFRIWRLWIDTKMINGNKKFWRASTYSPVEYKKRK